MIIRTNPSEILPRDWEGFGDFGDAKLPSLPHFRKSFPILPKVFWKDFGRRKSRNNNKNHTLSPIKNKSFPAQGPRAIFLVCVWVGRIYLGRIRRTGPFRDVNTFQNRYHKSKAEP